jgi:hypothetical protein
MLAPVRRSQSLVNAALNRPWRPGVSRSSSPLRQFTLLGGDRFLAEIVRWEDQQIELRLRGGQTVPVPRAAIAGVGVPNGEADLVYESFEQVSAGGKSPGVERPTIIETALDTGDSAGGLASLKLLGLPQRVLYSFPELPTASRVQFWFRVGESDADRPELRVDFNFQAGSVQSGGVQTGNVQTGETASRWRMTAGHRSAEMTVDGQLDDSATRRTVSLRRGWHCLTAAFLDDRVVCVVDEALLASSNRPAGRLRSVEFAATAPAWIDDLHVGRMMAPVNTLPVRPSPQDDCVALHDGDRLFGRIARVTSENVVLTGPAGDRVVSWNDVDKMALRQSDRAASGRPTSPGLWAQLEFQSNVDRPRQPPDRMTATITDIRRDFLVVDHPWLGEFAIDWNQVARIEPQFNGRCLTIDARTLHLGDAIRADFQRPVPDGTEWSGGFDIGPLPVSGNAEVWLSLDAVDLEPAGSQTPPGSPFLKELRSGRLLTELTINDQRAGDLNRWIRFRAAPDRPERLRCRLPLDALRTGRNELRLRQIPFKESGTRFDNCELSNLRLEIVEPAADH